MVSALKKKNGLSAIVPVKTEGNATVGYAFDAINDSIRVAEKSDNHHSNTMNAERDAHLTHAWETLPLYEHGDNAPKKELFNFFKKTLKGL